jgi:hypothetical protein
MEVNSRPTAADIQQYKKKNLAWACGKDDSSTTLWQIHRVFPKELYNFKTVCKCIQRICTMF